MSDETLKKNIKATTFVAGLLGGALFVQGNRIKIQQ